MEQYRGTYIGSTVELLNKTAIVRCVGKNYLLAQFDDLQLPNHLTHGWQVWHRSVFRVETYDGRVLRDDEATGQYVPENAMEWTYEDERDFNHCPGNTRGPF